MTLYELAGWGALIEAIDLIADKLEDRGLSFDRIGDVYLNPLPIRKYVDYRRDEIMNKLSTDKTNKSKTNIYI